MTIYNLNTELGVVAKWFYNIAKLANEKKTANGVVMNDSDTLKQIETEARIAAEYVENYLLIEKQDV